MNGRNYVRFVEKYRECLYNAMTDYPADYGLDRYNDDRFTKTYTNMCEAFRTGNFNHNSRAIRDTCKALKIRFTRAAIVEFINGDTPQ